jgi:CBS domain-containing protein
MVLKIENVMISDVIKVEADATIRQAVDLMNKHEIGCLVVVDEEERPVGILTERDLLRRVLAKRRDPVKTKVSQVMSKPLVTGTPHMNLEVAVKLMFRKKIKKLPIVEDGRLVGLVTLTDIVRVQPHIIKMVKRLAGTEPPPKRMKKVVDYYVV